MSTRKVMARKLVYGDTINQVYVRLSYGEPPTRSQLQCAHGDLIGGMAAPNRAGYYSWTDKSPYLETKPLWIICEDLGPQFNEYGEIAP